MKKIVPDPPLFTTAHQGTSLFSINPGVPMQEALKHASLLLKGAELTADDIRSHLSCYESRFGAEPRCPHACVSLRTFTFVV